MRAAGLLVLGLMVAGCIELGGTEPPLPPTISSTGAMVFQALGETIVPVPLPPEFGDGMRVATQSTGERGAEPNIGVTIQGSIFVSAYESILRSRDLGKTWEEVYRMRLGQTFDPMLWVDTPTGRVYSTHINPDKTCSTLIYSDNADDDAPTWRELPLRCPSPIVDHQKIATGPFTGPLAPTGTLLPYSRLVSLCYNKLPNLSGDANRTVAATHCAISLDGGVTYPIDNQVDQSPGSAVPQSSPANCGGLNGHQAHGPDGAIYLPYGYGCRRGRLAVSADGGLTWTRHDLEVDQVELDPEVAITSNGMAYYLYRGGDQAMHMLRSRDRFETFEGPFRVSPPEIKGTVFAGLAAGSAGRLAFAYLGTTDVDAGRGVGPDDAGETTVWDLYTGMTLDAEAEAPTIVTVRVNPENDPVQRGSICHSKNCKDGNRNLLDFIDMVAGPDGRFWVSYTDGCTSDLCRRPGQTNVALSRDDTASVAWLLEGPSLLQGREPLTG